MTGSTSVSGRVYEHLRERILAGEYAAWGSLPSERKLSDDLGASRHAVREALKRLQQSGLVRISQGGATRVRDWRRHGGLELLLELAASGEIPAELGVERAVMEMRASVGADAARKAAGRATAVQRAELEARAELIAAEHDLTARNAIYETFWDLIVESSGNLAYRLALNTLVTGQELLAFDATLIAHELRDEDAIRQLAAAVAHGRAEEARQRGIDLLERSI